MQRLLNILLLVECLVRANCIRPPGIGIAPAMPVVFTYKYYLHLIYETMANTLVTIGESILMVICLQQI